MQNHPARKYEVQSRGELEVKGKGIMYTYWLVSSSPLPSINDAINSLERKMATEMSDIEKVRVTEEVEEVRVTEEVALAV